jgi:hypothetical protein
LNSQVKSLNFVFTSRISITRKVFFVKLIL